MTAVVCIHVVLRTQNVKSSSPGGVLSKKLPLQPTAALALLPKVSAVRRENLTLKTEDPGRSMRIHVQNFASTTTSGKYRPKFVALHLNLATSLYYEKVSTGNKECAV
jgi:hypothetical protein